MLEPVNQQYVRIGRIARSHGVDGAVLMIPELYAPALFETVDLVRIRNARGDLVPARVESVRVQEKNNRLSFFVKFDHLTDRNAADQLKSCPVFISREQAAPWLDEETADDMTGFTVYDEGGTAVGRVTEIISSPAHPILSVQTTGGEALLIPFVDEYVARTEAERQAVHCRNLEQLTGA